MMHGLTVCVDYSDYLALSLPRWALGLDTLTVVTTQRDLSTQEACHYYSTRLVCELRMHVTDAFYLDGAHFNKGRAMEEARVLMPWEDWILFFDADIVPEPFWRFKAPDGLSRAFLYGCSRFSAPELAHLDDWSRPKESDDRIGYGYFQLFHSGHPNVQRRPLLDTHWRHAGNYDSNFLLSFGPLVRELPIGLWHSGQKGEWFGRGQRQTFDAMQKTRDGRGIHDSEKLKE